LFFGSVVGVVLLPPEEASVVVVDAVIMFDVVALVERSMRNVAPTKSMRMMITTPSEG
jgi:hypothetical protein